MEKYRRAGLVAAYERHVEWALEEEMVLWFLAARSNPSLPATHTQQECPVFI